MPVYEYIALDSGGRRRKGIVDAGSIAAARQKLRETEVFPVEIVEAADRKREETAARGGAIHLFRRVGLQELALMTRQLATLIGAGLPLVPSLSALVAQIRHPVLKTTLAQIKDEVNEGIQPDPEHVPFPGGLSPLLHQHGPGRGGVGNDQSRPGPSGRFQRKPAGPENEDPVGAGLSALHVLHRERRSLFSGHLRRAEHYEHLPGDAPDPAGDHRLSASS